jgi:chromatin remodeling complex protein RSC6
MAAKKKAKKKAVKKKAKKKAVKKKAKKKAVKKKKPAKKKAVKKKAVKKKAKKKAVKKKAKKKVVKKKAKKKAVKKKKAKKKVKRKPNPAFMKPVTPDAALAAVVGAKPLPRTQLTKKLWAYIKKNGLQDKKNRRMINADAKLKPVFKGKAQVSMFEMTKLVSGHVK